MEDTRQPPHDADAELATIGSVLVLGQIALDEAGTLRCDDFYLPHHRDVWSAIAALAKRQAVIDPVAVGAEIAAAGSGNRFPGGWSAWSIGAMTQARVVHVVGAIADIVRQMATLRRVIDLATDLANRAYARQPAEEVLATAREEVAKLEISGDDGEADRFGDVVGAALDEVERRCRGEGVAIKSSISTLQSKIGGYKPGQLIVVAAATGEGKSAFAAVQESLGAAVDHGVPALVSSHEMATQDLIERMLGQMAGVEVWRIVNGKLGLAEWKKLQDCAGGKLGSAPLYLDDRTHALPKLCGHVRRWHARHVRAKGAKTALVVVDYLQLVDASVGKSATREREVAAVSRAMKLLAKDLGVAIILVSQLSRAYQQRGGRPMLSDLRESGAIEQDADVVLFVHCDAKPEDRKTRSQSGPRELIVGKQRQGWTGTIPVIWTRETMKFTPGEAEEDEDARDAQPNWQDGRDDE